MHTTAHAHTTTTTHHRTAHNQTCPTALDVVVYDRLPVARTERHRHPSAQSVHRIFVWSDSTLAEVGALLAQHVPACRARGCRVLYGLRRPNSTRNTVRRCGYTRTDGEGAEDQRTLAQCGFRAGDVLCVAAERWSFQKEKRARAHAAEDAEQETREQETREKERDKKHDRERSHEHEHRPRSKHARR